LGNIWKARRQGWPGLESKQCEEGRIWKWTDCKLVSFNSPKLRKMIKKSLIKQLQTKRDQNQNRCQEFVPELYIYIYIYYKNKK
jgi:hypothetical protein